MNFHECMKMWEELNERTRPLALWRMDMAKPLTWEKVKTWHSKLCEDKKQEDK